MSKKITAVLPIVITCDDADGTEHKSSASKLVGAVRAIDYMKTTFKPTWINVHIDCRPQADSEADPQPEDAEQTES